MLFITTLLSFSKEKKKTLIHYDLLIKNRTKIKFKDVYNATKET